ncbi:MAG: hypothetical protein Q7L07_09550, partial [Pseudohongiella sp.]|nr:hypothetical protein [Pseudohongiella sp.]
MVNSLIQKLALCLALMFATPALIAQVQDEHEVAIASAMAALDEFMLTFNSRDPVAWAGSLNYPHVRFASGTVTIWNS